MKTPDLFTAHRVLCIQPHYDDNDIGIGGTIALLRDAGAEIHYLTVTDDLMGVTDDTLNDAEATADLDADQAAAGKILGVRGQIKLNFPDAGEYRHIDVRSHILRALREVQPDFVLTCDPWLTYEAHRDHIRTGMAAAEAIIFAGLTKIPSSDPVVDARYVGHEIRGVAFYNTREPNVLVDITSVWDDKVRALRCYETQFSPEDMESLVNALDAKSREFADEEPFDRAEGLKVVHPNYLHIGL